MLPISCQLGGIRGRGANYEQVRGPWHQDEDKVEDIGYVANFLPTRRHKGGGGPTMRSEQVKGPWHQDEICRDKLQWVHKPPPRNVKIRRKILGKAIEVGVKILFTTFAYTFGGKIYHQLDGAPIGTRIACAAANLVMEYLWDRVRAYFRDSGQGFKLWLALNFVDDARCWVTTFRLGTRFKRDRFEWSQEAQIEDETAGLTPEDVTFR